MNDALTERAFNAEISALGSLKVHFELSERKTDSENSAFTSFIGARSGAVVEAIGVNHVHPLVFEIA